MERNKSLFEQYRIARHLNIVGHDYEVTGIKVSTNTERPLAKLILQKENKQYWLEFQFYGENQIILWEGVTTELTSINKSPAPTQLTFRDEQFSLQDSGVSEIEESEGKGDYYHNEQIDWWDYQYGKEMLSIGWLRKKQQWENLYGRLLSSVDIAG